MIQIKADEPYVSLWFGNFFEPAFSNREYIDCAMKDIARMGFNCVLLDSKSWQDFWDRYDGKGDRKYALEYYRSLGMAHAEKDGAHYFMIILMR